MLHLHGKVSKRNARKKVLDRLMKQIWTIANSLAMLLRFNRIQVTILRALKVNLTLATAQSNRFRASQEAAYLMKMMNSR